MTTDNEASDLKETISQVKRDVLQLTDLFADVQKRLNRISRSLQFCQSRCHVDNPGRWSKLWEAIVGLFARSRRVQVDVLELDVKDPSAKGIVR